MNSILNNAKALLKSGGYTCVVCSDSEEYFSRERGVKPLLKWLDCDADFNGFCAADKVVGKAAAFLYVLLGVKAVYAPVMSQRAIEVFRQYEIDIEYDTAPQAIINRTNTGICPMESAVWDITTPDEAYTAIKETLIRLNSSQQNSN